MMSPADTLGAATETDLAAAWRRYRERHPACQLIDAADVLGVPEAALVASECGTTATRLQPAWTTLLAGLADLGRVRLTLGTRGAWISRCCTLPRIDAGEGILHIVNGHEAMSAEVYRWSSAFAVSRSGSSGNERGLTIFDETGRWVLDVHVPREGWTALDRLETDTTSPDQSPVATIPPPEPGPSPARPNDDVDIAGLRTAWDELTVSTSFDLLLRRFGVSRAQAYRLAGPTRAERIEPTSLGGVLAHAASRGRPISLRVFSAAASCLYLGTIAMTALRSGWACLRGPCVAAGIKLDALEQAWSVRRPGVNGSSISLEFFDGDDRRLLAVALPSHGHVDYL